MLEHMSSWKSLYIFAKGCSNDDLVFSLTYFIGTVVELVEDYGTSVNKYNYIYECMYIFANEIKIIL